MNLPTIPVLIEKVEFKGYENAGLYLTRFVDKNLPVLFIGNADEEVVYLICNINPDDNYELKEFEFAIKDYSENEGTEDWLVKNEFLHPHYYSYLSGWVEIPICVATDKLKGLIIERCQTTESLSMPRHGEDPMTGECW